MSTDTDNKAAALLRIRTLRRDGYRCQHCTKRGNICGKPASLTGFRPADEKYVALCPAHYLAR